MSTLSVAELQAQIETDLDSSTLTQIIDAVERDIQEWAGATAAEVQEFDETDLIAVIRLPIQAASITSIVEYTDAEHAPTKTTLASNDYELSTDGWEVRRKSTGTNARDTWGWHLVVTYAPATDTARRKQVAIQLARLEITHSGYGSERIGDWSAQGRELRKERAEILSRLDESLVS